MFPGRKNRIKQETNLSSLNDRELIESYKKSGENIYLGELFVRYTHLIYGVCMKYLKNRDHSQDATMDIFEDLPSKLVKHEINNFKSWMHTVAKNHCLMILRKKNRAFHLETEVIERFHYDVMETDQLFHQSGDDKTEQLNKLYIGLEKLKEEQRKCIELLYLQQKSYKEVSEITGYDLNKVKSYIQNGKRNLKIFLEKQ